MRNMRILQVTPGYYPALGGVEQHVQSISEALAQMGHTVVVATMTSDRRLPRHDMQAGVMIRRFSALGSYPYQFPIGLFRYLQDQQQQFDIIHAHNYHALPLLAAVAACRQRTIITPYYHGHGHSAVAEALHYVYDPFAAALMRETGGVICVSPSEADLVSERFGIARAEIAIVPNFSAVSEARPTITTKKILRAPGQQCLILSVGRLESYKRVDRIIGALPYMPAEFELAVVGTGPGRSALERLAAHLGVSDRVRFLGHLSDDELRSWYERAAITVSLSASESFGRVVLEGLAAGCRVVCSSIPAFQDLAAEFPQAMVLVSPDIRSSALAMSLVMAASWPQATISLRNYTRQSILDNLMQVYTNFLERDRRLSYSVAQKERSFHENSAGL
jgi:glycosyltransferase involved in cell wall biosynthesis